MPQSEPTVEASAELVVAKPKRKPRTRVKDLASVTNDDIADLPESLITELPKIRRTRRTKVVASSIQPEPEELAAVSLDQSTARILSIDTELADLQNGTPSFEIATPAPLTGVIAPFSIPASQSLHPQTVLLSRALRAGRYADLPALGDAALLGLRLMQDPTSGAAPDPYCALILNLPGGPIEVGDGVRLVLAMTGIDLGHSAVELPHTQWLHSAVIGRLAQTPLRDVTSITRGCLPPDQDAASVPLHNVRMTLRSQHHAFSIQARASASSWLDLLTRWRWHYERLPVDVFNDMPVRLPVLVATHSVPQAMLRTIDVGDVIIADTAAFDTEGNGRIRWCGMQFHVRFHLPASLTLLNLEPSMEPHDDIDSASDDVQVYAVPHKITTIDDNALDGLPVQLQFEMGRCTTTLAALRTLAPGTVLPIDGGSPSVIAIVANGRQLGRGELVDVNGQLGIRIVFWSR